MLVKQKVSSSGLIKKEKYNHSKQGSKPLDNFVLLKLPSEKILLDGNDMGMEIRGDSLLSFPKKDGHRPVI